MPPSSVWCSKVYVNCGKINPTSTMASSSPLSIHPSNESRPVTVRRTGASKSLCVYKQNIYSLNRSLPLLVFAYRFPEDPLLYFCLHLENINRFYSRLQPPPHPTTKLVARCYQLFLLPFHFRFIIFTLHFFSPNGRNHQTTAG